MFRSRRFYVLTNFTIHFTLCLIFRKFWPMLYILRHEQVCLMMFNERYSFERYFWTDKWKYIPYISVTHTKLKSCRSKMTTLTHDVCDVHGAFSLYIKTCWQSLYRVYPTGAMRKSPHEPKICSITRSPPNFYSLPLKVNSTQ